MNFVDHTERERERVLRGPYSWAWNSLCNPNWPEFIVIFWPRVLSGRITRIRHRTWWVSSILCSFGPFLCDETVSFLINRQSFRNT